MLGAILAIFVILLFLRSVRSTLVTAVSIPLSVLIALSSSTCFDVSPEHHEPRGPGGGDRPRGGRQYSGAGEHLQAPLPARRAAARRRLTTARKEVSTAITSSTITTVAVFLPLGFIAGLVSEFFRPFAVAVTVSLLASLLVALTSHPGAGALLPEDRRRQGPQAARRSADHAEERDTLVQRLYTPAIKWVLKNRAGPSWRRLVCRCCSS